MNTSKENTKNSAVEKIASEIQQLIRLEAEKMSREEKQYREKFECLCSVLMRLIEEEEALKEDFDANNFTVLSIEAQGSLRFAGLVKSVLEEYK